MHPFTAVEGNLRSTHHSAIRGRKNCRGANGSSPPESLIEHSVPVMLAEIV